MNSAFVTGATGFVGAHLVRALVERGSRVVCLARPSSRLDNIEGLPVEIAPGDLRDLESVRRAMDGADVAYHCAADYRLWVKDPAAMYATNVDGTENVMRAAAEGGAGRVVYTSTVGALGLAPSGTPADECAPVRLSHMIGHYKRSKFLAERAVEDHARQGLNVVIVNPSTPVGELDVKPTATGKVIVDFLAGRMPAYVDTGLNLIDVKDVAAGHLLAAERGVAGEKYILGHANLTLKQLFDLLSGITGIPSPRVRLPHWVPLTVSACDALWCSLTQREPRVPLDAVRLSRHKMFFDSSKAVRELGLPQTSVEAALARAVAWFRGHGYVGSRAA